MPGTDIIPCPAPSACDATTFITEWGRYRYLRTPQGFHAAGDAYTRAYDDIVIDIKRKSKVADNTFVWDKNISEAFVHAAPLNTLICAAEMALSSTLRNLLLLVTSRICWFCCLTLQLLTFQKDQEVIFQCQKILLMPDLDLAW